MQNTQTSWWGMGSTQGTADLEDEAKQFLSDIITFEPERTLGRHIRTRIRGRVPLSVLLVNINSSGEDLRANMGVAELDLCFFGNLADKMSLTASNFEVDLLREECVVNSRYADIDDIDEFPSLIEVPVIRSDPKGGKVGPRFKLSNQGEFLGNARSVFGRSVDAVLSDVDIVVDVSAVDTLFQFLLDAVEVINGKWPFQVFSPGWVRRPPTAPPARGHAAHREPSPRSQGAEEHPPLQQPSVPLLRGLSNDGPAEQRVRVAPPSHVWSLSCAS